MKADDVKQALQAHADAEQAETNRRFFKTGPGQYGEGDTFIGVSVPHQRKVAKQFRSLPLKEAEKLFKSPIHEHRLSACLVLVYKYQAAKTNDDKTAIYDFYTAQLEAGRINGWDMVDTSVPHIIGDYLLDKSRQLLYGYANSGDLWLQRAAIMATFTFIKHNDYFDTLAIAEQYVYERHDLLQKATGWMLREVANRDQLTAEMFLKKHYRHMGRTMLRYAIEKFEPERRQSYLNGTA